MEIYPSHDIAASTGCPMVQGAPVADVIPASPADDAGFYPGCIVTHVNGRALTDILLWQWESAGDTVDLAYIDGEGDAGEVTLERDVEEPWGFVFDGNIFDGVRLCKNACTFCFMTQLPRGMRPSLSLRDDDFRLSFLQGTFVTLTNVSDEDVARIIEERISPLRMSLHAYNPEVRAQLIGKRAARGIEVLEQLLEGGIEVYAQIVLCPGVNDGAVLEETLAWSYAHPGIVEVGIVPLGFTDFQHRFSVGFDDTEAAAAVLSQVEPFQRRALGERGNPWVYCADEFYVNAYGPDTPAHLPAADFYGDCSMYEDGIGIVRTYADSWDVCEQNGMLARIADRLRETDAFPVLVVGESVADFAQQTIENGPLRGLASHLFVHNAYFGGNVNVTGLLCGCDIVRAVREYKAPADKRAMFCLPELIFNDDGLTLDGMTLARMEEDAGTPLHVVSCLPEDFFPEIEKDLL